MADRKPKGKKQDKVDFNPNLKYGWEKDQEFTVTGEEFDIILKSLQLAADTPEFKRNVAIFQGLNVVSTIFKESVEQGLIKEQGSLDSRMGTSEDPIRIDEADPSPNLTPSI